jgi:hypothetical protein
MLVLVVVILASLNVAPAESYDLLCTGRGLAFVVAVFVVMWRERVPFAFTLHVVSLRQLLRSDA